MQFEEKLDDFYSTLMIEVRKMEVLPFALLLLEANATIEL